MASRLSFALWGTTPDAALLDAAERGELLDDAGLEAQARRLLDDPRAQRHMVGFFSEYMSLERLPTATKDAQLFPEATDALKGSMRRELEALFEEIAFVQERDLRELLTTDAALVDDGLAAVYGLPQRGGEWWDVLPAEQGRGGLLGRAGLMTVYSHATLNSPTLRGKFIRTRLLCQDVPPPPPGVRTELEEPAEGEGPQTLRQRLDAHRADPNCAGCHALMDPLGYPLEHFDPIGRRRETDHGLPIDATGEVDGVEVDGAADLGRALAAHPLLGDCWTRQLYRFATGHLELPGERPVIQSLAQGWDEDQYRLKALLLRLVMSDGFRKATAPQNEACDPQQGRERACESACGVGVERCTQGLWSACSAPAPGVEACDGRDNDCDGEVDEGLVRACGEASCGGAGVQTCGDGGQWGACSQPSPPAEICDGADNDCDGQVDEEVEVERRAVSFEALAARHDVCDGAREQRGPNCNAAIHRFCAGTGCASTGFGPVGVSGGEASLVCLSPSKAQPQGTTYSHLVTIHDGCDGQNQRLGPHCNAAIHRFCAGLGLTSGFGPLENSGDDLAVACTPGAEVVVGSYSELGAHNGACQAGAERVGPSCDNAIHLACVGRGFVSGFGPVENSGDTAVFTCVR
jgi:hypothetical protein